MLEIISQIGVFIFSASAIWVVGREESWNRWGYILGLLGQPFWFYSVIINKQWGLLILCIWYLYAWGQGFYVHWIKRKNLLKKLNKEEPKESFGYTADSLSVEEGHLEIMIDKIKKLPTLEAIGELRNIIEKAKSNEL